MTAMSFGPVKAELGSMSVIHKQLRFQHSAGWSGFLVACLGHVTSTRRRYTVAKPGAASTLAERAQVLDHMHKVLADICIIIST